MYPYARVHYRSWFMIVAHNRPVYNSNNISEWSSFLVCPTCSEYTSTNRSSAGCSSFHTLTWLYFLTSCEVKYILYIIHFYSIYRDEKVHWAWWTVECCRRAIDKFESTQSFLVFFLAEWHTCFSERINVVVLCRGLHGGGWRRVHHQVYQHFIALLCHHLHNEKVWVLKVSKLRTTYINTYGFTEDWAGISIQMYRRSGPLRLPFSDHISRVCWIQLKQE